MTLASLPTSTITVWKEILIPIDRQWEAAYERFETPAQEIAKFKRRLQILGQQSWRRHWKIVELFCGRGNGLHALSQLGFENLEGVDLSEELLRRYQGPATLFAGDCRELKFEDCSRDVIIVQGGLHHLPQIPADLEVCLREIHRVLRPEGMFCMVEPWQTPFLSLAHSVSDNPIARRLWAKLDALAEMTERELTTYRQWLDQPQTILDAVERLFDVQLLKISYGKIVLRATPKK
jgi:SAM-dependent methyltransferase